MICEKDEVTFFLNRCEGRKEIMLEETCFGERVIGDYSMSCDKLGKDAS